MYLYFILKDGIIFCSYFLKEDFIAFVWFFFLVIIFIDFNIKYDYKLGLN